MLRTLLLLTALPAGAGLVVAAEGGAPDLTPVKGAVVVVRVSGVDTEHGNKLRAVQGTGFFISKEGYLITSYHLRTMLDAEGKVNEGTVDYEVRFGPTSNDVLKAGLAFPMPYQDLMVLFASLGDRDVPVFARGTRDGVQLGVTQVFTMGYPEGYQYSVDAGIIKSFGLVDPVPAWATNLTFKNGASGSPICLDDKRVIAVARGDDADAKSIGLVVSIRPIPDNYWDSK